MLLDMFCIIIYDYDVRNPADFEEMKDTAGLSEMHFQGIRKKLYPHLEEWGFDPEEPNFQLLLRMDQLCGNMGTLEAMRDSGAQAPRFGLNDKVVRRDGGDSPLSAAGSDEIEFFIEGEMVEVQPKFDGQASAGKTEK